MPRRRIHLGIDYGTSTSKIVIRDYGAPGGERATVLTEAGSFRFSSSVALLGDRLILGYSPTGTSDAQARMFESLKMRVAAEVKGDSERYCYAPLEKLPERLTAADLATLTIARLINKGARASTARWGAELALGMTLGVPMSFFTDLALRGTFLRIARAAWRLWRADAIGGDSILVAEARHCLDEAYASVDAAAVPDNQVRDWIRSEAEAAMWWAFQSPSVPAGPYAKVDIGAGTTNASVFRIVDGYADGRWIKEKLAFFGAYSHALGMDAVDEALAKWKGVPPERRLQLRGSEDDLLQDSRALQACQEPIKGIRQAFSDAWRLGFEKYRGSRAEVKQWMEGARVFIIGGGSLAKALRTAIEKHPQDSGTRLLVSGVECPPDLEVPGARAVPPDALPFLTVAYGLSNLGLAIPEVRTPDEVLPLPRAEDRRRQLDHEDIYAK